MSVKSKLSFRTSKSNMNNPMRFHLIFPVKAFPHRICSYTVSPQYVSSPVEQLRIKPWISSYTWISSIKPNMNNPMRFHIIFRIKAFPTKFTFIRFLSSMYPLMSTNQRRSPKYLQAYATLVAFRHHFTWNEHRHSYRQLYGPFFSQNVLIFF